MTTKVFVLAQIQREVLSLLKKLNCDASWTTHFEILDRRYLHVKCLGRKNLLYGLRPCNFSQSLHDTLLTLSPKLKNVVKCHVEIDWNHIVPDHIIIYPRQVVFKGQWTQTVLEEHLVMSHKINKTIPITYS